MSVNLNDWSAHLISERIKKPMPILTYPGLQITGKKVIDLVTNAQHQADCIVSIAEKFDTAAAVMVMDLSVEAEAFGSQISFSDEEIPTVSQRLVSDEDSINQIKVPEYGTARSAEYVKASTLAMKKVKNKPLFGGIIGPYSLAGRLFDITEFMTYVLINPVSSIVLLEKCTNFLVEYAKAFKNAGTNGIIIAEPAAGLLPAEMCHELSSIYVKRIVDKLQDDTFMVILHNCGNTLDLVPTMLSTGAAGLHFGNAVDITNILPQVPIHIPVFGNLDPVSIFKSGNREQVYQKTTALLEKTKNFPNFILSSGCDIPPGSPLENVKAFFKATFDFYN